MPRQLRLLSAVALLLPAFARAAAVELPRTGQSTCYDEIGAIVPCANTGQDADVQAGAGWPSPRFSEQGDGTVTDRLTGLVWLKDAHCTDTAGGVARTDGLLTWPSALAWSNGLSTGRCGLADGSRPGDWRLPNINELRSLVDYSRHDPALPPDSPFVNVQSAWYWSSTTNPVFTAGAFNVGMSRGSIHVTSKVGNVLTLGASRVQEKATSRLGVWPVRGGATRAREAPAATGGGNLPLAPEACPTSAPSAP